MLGINVRIMNEVRDQQKRDHSSSPSINTTNSCLQFPDVSPMSLDEILLVSLIVQYLIHNSNIDTSTG